jgi:hypothetical protein
MGRLCAQIPEDKISHFDFLAAMMMVVAKGWVKLMEQPL